MSSLRHSATIAALVVALCFAGVGPAAAGHGGAGTASTTDAGTASTTDAGTASTTDAGTIVEADPAVTPTNCTFPVTRTDATGTTVTVAERPDRITVLSPSTAQTVWAIGAADRVVGAPVNPTSTYLEGIENRTNVDPGGQSPVDTEAVVGTQPDVVLAANIVRNETVRQLRRANLTVFKFRSADSIAAVGNKTRLTGRLVGACEGAATTNREMFDAVETVDSAVEGRDRPRVFFSMGGGWTASHGTFIHSLVDRAGGDNVAANANTSGYAKLSSEVVVEQDPEWIVAQSGLPKPYPQTAAFNGTTAVREGNVATVNANYVSQPGPRVVLALAAMAHQFHPDAIEEGSVAPPGVGTDDPAADGTTTRTPTATATSTSTSTEPGPTSTTPAATTTGGSGPGFGVPAALVAGALAVLGLRRSRR